MTLSGHDMPKTRTWFAWPALIAVITAVELVIRFALSFNLRRVLVVEALLFFAAALCVRDLINRPPHLSGWRRTIQWSLVWAFALAALRAAIWAAGQTVMRANLATLVTAVVVLIWSRKWRRN